MKLINLFRFLALIILAFEGAHAAAWTATSGEISDLRMYNGERIIANFSGGQLPCGTSDFQIKEDFADSEKLALYKEIYSLLLVAVSTNRQVKLQLTVDPTDCAGGLSKIIGVWLYDQ
ncbi:MAG: hypothetical protein KUG79_14025 [Pseudomonadales bacterium]|nr:hypothetical protein [Pseudomonadales bacterium]